ncbi:hypothetical protein DdX_12677 [Ditylenchus destructor]|uniref:Uncharacterized protein n=1 Tax=Ditylenchus destructor TaxID=166010 RepID=A0AAD4MXE4_9BILA|nr:hypothetical protein DdX_12677 [Ditylenchus destructor]
MALFGCIEATPQEISSMNAIPYALLTDELEKQSKAITVEIERLEESRKKHNQKPRQLQDLQNLRPDFYAVSLELSEVTAKVQALLHKLNGMKEAFGFKLELSAEERLDELEKKKKYHQKRVNMVSRIQFFILFLLMSNAVISLFRLTVVHLHKVSTSQTDYAFPKKQQIQHILENLESGIEILVSLIAKS